jgi:Asp-tRNA(Asn)/Glu-tRNA(Gln) amidotransferase C subunit
MGERMSIGLDEVLHVAKLAELAVRENELRRLVDQMNRIVDYVATLDEVPVPLARPPAAMAPEFREGFFLVPRHGAMEDQ